MNDDELLSYLYIEKEERKNDIMVFLFDTHCIQSNSKIHSNLIATKFITHINEEHGQDITFFSNTYSAYNILNSD